MNGRRGTPFVKSSVLFTLVWLPVLQVFSASAAEFTVVLDPGHSPKSPGAVSARGTPEVEFNDRLAKEIAGQLEAGGNIRVVLSRGPQEELGLKQRVKRIHAADPDLVVSIHHDSVQPHFLSGWEHQGKKLRYSDRFSGFSLFVPTQGYYAEVSRLAARRLADRLLAAKYAFSTYHAMKIPGESRKWVDSARGIFAGDFLYLSRHLRAPFVLLEAGVIVHRDEEARLSRPEEIKKLAGHIASAVTGLKRRFKGDRSKRRPAGPHVREIEKP